MKPETLILKNAFLEVHVCTLGAALTRMLVVNAAGRRQDVLLGMEKASDYERADFVKGGSYLGAAIGRYGNRIAEGRFVLDGKEYRLAVNNGRNHLHGGLSGFDRKLWKVEEAGPERVRLSYSSADGEENYPGNLDVEVDFSLKDASLCLDYRARTDRNCPVNLTHHPYFNLDPEAVDVKGHELKLYTSHFLHTCELIPDGQLVEMDGDYDFRSPRSLAGVIGRHGGLDDCFAFADDGRLKRMADLSCPKTGLKLTVSSDYPGLQVYTGRYLDVREARGGRYYGPYAGVALEAQFWPDSPNHADFPSTVLKPGEEYRRRTVYGFE